VSGWSSQILQPSMAILEDNFFLWAECDKTLINILFPSEFYYFLWGPCFWGFSNSGKNNNKLRGKIPKNSGHFRLCQQPRSAHAPPARTSSAGQWHTDLPRWSSQLDICQQTAHVTGVNSTIDLSPLLFKPY
jgi:hypothetical protein